MAVRYASTNGVRRRKRDARGLEESGIVSIAKMGREAPTSALLLVPFELRQRLVQALLKLQRDLLTRDALGGEIA